jgi:uncharacterized delta-60 repeat protein
MFQNIPIARTRAAFAASIFSVLSTLCATAAAQPFTPDLNFGTAGRVVVPLSAGVSADRHGLAVTSDGKILIGGICYVPNAAICVVRLLPGGVIDNTFAASGKLLLADDALNTEVAIVLQRDGKLIVTATCTPAATLVLSACAYRFHVNGSIDTSFGSAGRSAVAVPNRDPFMNGRTTLSGDGKIVLSGICDGVSDDNRFCAIRLLSNGLPDPNFGANGVAVIAFPPTVYFQDRATHVLQSDGKVVMSGECGLQPSLARVPCLSRLTNAGLIDESFGTLGHIVMSPAAVQTATQFTDTQDILLRPDGSFLVLNNYGNIFGKISLLAFTRDGLLDSSFGNAGRQIHSTGETAFSFRVEAQPDGRLVVNSRCADVNFNTSECIARFNADGSIDTTFPITQLPSTAGDPNTRMLQLQSDGKIVIAGTCKTGTDAQPIYNFCAARFNGGPLDHSRCTGDVDGDGAINSNDSILLARVSLGLTGDAVTQGLSFAQHATRQTWITLRNHLFNQCAMSINP